MCFPFFELEGLELWGWDGSGSVEVLALDLSCKRFSLTGVGCGFKVHNCFPESQRLFFIKQYTALDYIRTLNTDWID